VCFLDGAVCLAAVFEVSNKYMLVIDSILIAIVAVYGLNLLTGFAGLISIGHAAFVGVGAYTLASFARVLGSDHVLLTHCWPLMILVAGGVGAVFGAIVGLPSLRLKHLYLVIATLSFQMIFQWTHQLYALFQPGADHRHRAGILVYRQSGSQEHYFFWYYVILVLVVMLGFAVRNLLRTKHGRCLVAVRDNDRAADAMGMHPGFTKVYAFALSGFFAGSPAPCTPTCGGGWASNPSPCTTPSPTWPWPSWAAWAP
jgi:branched-chain amino acid transport system permease protein